MKFDCKAQICVVLFLVFVLSQCQSRSTEISGTHHESINPYVNFLRKTHEDPVDYVMGLFNKFDIVILCERAHPEITQYDFIYRLVSNPKFIDEVGHVFTEVGTSLLNEDLDDFLKAGDIIEEEAERRLLSIYRNMAFHPVWNNLNFYEFLRRVRHLNASLSVREKINLYFSDMPFTWDGMTKEKYERFQKTLPQRDQVMADQIIHKFLEIQKSDLVRKKVLIIMNFRHAFNDRFELPGGKKPGNVGRYIFEAFPGQAANVMINSVRIMLGSTDQDIIMAPIQEGKWDAAFAVMNNPDTGFDLESSPFGQDVFDYFPARRERLTYQDVFTGFIFYRPLEKHAFLTGVQGLFEDGFNATAVSRYVLTGVAANDAKQYVEENRKLNESRYDNLEDFDKEIQKWLNVSEKKQE